MYDFNARMLGYTTNAYIFSEVIGSPSNIYTSSNPKFGIDEDFFPVFPNFQEIMPRLVLNMFYTIADNSIKEKRFKSAWKYVMCLYIAHLSTLYLRTIQGGSTAEAVLQSALPKGMVSSKSVDALSISYDYGGVTEDLAGFGTFKYTIYGQQLATYCKLYKGIGLWVR